MRAARAVAVLAVASAFVLAGCGSDGDGARAPGAAPATTSAAPVEGGVDHQAMRVDVYERMEDLSAESQVVLVGTVRDVSRGDLNGTASNHVRVAVERTARGSVPEEVTVVELPSMGPEFPPPFEVGRSYLLYLVDTTLKQHPEHHYYVSGISGVFAVEGDQVRRLDPGSPKLPEVQDLEPLLRAAATEQARPQRTAPEDLR